MNGRMEVVVEEKKTANVKYHRVQFLASPD
jgi:hypothetical protein